MFSWSVLGAGALAVGLVLVGTILIQITFALGPATVTPRCVEAGIRRTTRRRRARTALCDIVEGLESGSQTVVLYLSLGIGAYAVAAGFGAYRSMRTRRRRDQCIAGAALGVQAIAIAGFILWFRTGEIGIFFFQFANAHFLQGTFDAFARGAVNTMKLAVVGELGGIAIGLILALFAISKRAVVRAPARAYINLFRGTPLILQLSLAYFGVILGLQIQAGAITVAMIVLALNTGAYAAEVFRAGLQSIERGQMEAARSLGMSYLRAMRYAIVPQAVRRVIPPLMNEFVILIKDTSLVAVLGLTFAEYELYSTGWELYSTNLNATPFIAVAVAYLVVTLPLIGLVNIAERHLRSGLVGIGGEH